MSTIAEHIRIIRKNLEELSEEHAKHGNEFLAVVETEKALDEVERTLDEVKTVFSQRIDDKE